MILTDSQILALASNHLTQVQQLHDQLDGTLQQLNAHNATKGNVPFEAGNLVVCRGEASTMLEQLNSHITRATARMKVNETPAPPVAPAPAPAAAAPQG